MSTAWNTCRTLDGSFIPRPQRLYLRFGSPIDTSRPLGIGKQGWVDAVREKTQRALEQILADLQQRAQPAGLAGCDHAQRRRLTKQRSQC
jgi:1-acyl-sn-glycerol-3-phosphate acyltransferase